MIGIRPIRSRHSQLVHCRARRSRIVVVGIASFDSRTPSSIFSSVLRESPSAHGTDDRASRFSSRCQQCAGPATSAGLPAVRRPLRTAEQARASLFFQATKSQRWMPWRQEPMKDVSDCEKLRGAVYWASIRRCPNGETRHSSWSVTPV